MPATRRVHVTSPHDHDFERDMQAIREQLQLTVDFPADVEAEVRATMRDAKAPQLDRTDIPFVTLDPEGAMDLDQALHVERAGSHLRLHYAIADVGRFVKPGGKLDAEVKRRGETLYGADRHIPLHPVCMSEDAASLLPGVDRPALLWTIDVDADGHMVDRNVCRALVRSRAKLAYDSLQVDIDAGRADPLWDLVRELGELRIRRQRERGAISLGLPEQEIAVRDGRWVLEFRTRQPVEEWNEQLSLLTGMAAASIMVEAKTGLLRTLPDPDPHALTQIRHTARALDIDWPAKQPVSDFIYNLDPRNPTHVAMMMASTATLRGADYIAFDGSLPEARRHYALAAEYTHATAPLRRLVDRYTGEACLALCAGKPVPEWVLEAMPALPDIMRETGHRASHFEHAVTDLVEAVVLEGRVGETFIGAIVDIDKGRPTRGDAMVREPAIEARVDGDDPLPLGEPMALTLVEADPDKRKVRFKAGTGTDTLSA